MIIWDAVGYLASGLVVTAFCMKDILWLRMVALLSNAAFLTYGLGLDLVPVWLLHAVLLPVNLLRLRQYWSRENASTDGPPVRAIKIGAQRLRVSRSRRGRRCAQVIGAVTRVQPNARA